MKLSTRILGGRMSVFAQKRKITNKIEEKSKTINLLKKKKTNESI